MPRLRLATWNINSFRLRLPLLERLVASLDPDLILLQETKVPDELFPDAAPGALGFPYVLRRGMKSYNGVAILSRLPLALDETTPDWCGRGDCRHVAAQVALPSGPLAVHCFYVPAGGDVPDPAVNPKFAHKLAFMEEATAWFRANPPRRTLLAGDLNVAPGEHDVWSHRQLLDVVSHTPPETERMAAWLDTGFRDVARHFVPAEEKLYTWWSYRNRDWAASNRGRRLDHVWASRDLEGGLRAHTTLLAARDWPQTSDHVPVCMDVEV
jgi:exodeoxyribonuclease-3